MRNNPEDIEIRSEEVQEILGTPPGWMARWGTTLAFITFIALAWGAYWIKYPDIVESDITITTEDPPQTVYSPDGGVKISDILVANNDSVGRGEVLLVFDSRDNAYYNDVMILSDQLVHFDAVLDSALLNFNMQNDLRLGNGELSRAFYDFQKSQIDYSLSLQPMASPRQTESRIAQLRESIAAEEALKLKLAKEIDYAYRKLSRDEKRYEEQKISYDVLRNSKVSLTSLERSMQGAISNIKGMEFMISAIQRERSDERQDISSLQREAALDMREKFSQLKKTVEDWRTNNLVIAPVNGTVMYSQDNLREQAFISRRSPIFIVVPPDSTETIGKINLKIDGSGKVRPGQRVVVKLNSYPFPEFGAMVGHVKWKARVPIGEEIPIEVTFPDGLVTNSGEKIETSRPLQGKAEIITENKSLIDWVIQGFRSNRFR